MLPIRELRPEPLAREPRVVRALLWANLAAFLLQVIAPSLTFAYAFVPRTLQHAPAFSLVTIATSMFLHGSFLHLLGNLWFLWIFGPSVESALGSKRFAFVYLLSGVAAALGQAFLQPLPMLGASGAISGVLAAYVSLFPKRRIDTLAFLFVLPIPALFFVLEWFAINLLSGVSGRGGVAWWAHIGGFLAGLVLVRALFPKVEARPVPREVEVRGPNGERYPVITVNPRELHEWTGRSS